MKLKKLPVETAGFYSMQASEYHADPCPAPSLSNSIICRLLETSPLHAAAAHPRLSKQPIDEVSRRMEIGSAAHKLALDAGADIHVIQASSYRSGAASDERAQAVAAGKIAILEPDFQVARTIGQPLREAAEAYLGAPMSECLREVVLIWRVGKFWRRAMIDAMTPDLLRLVDLKATGGSAAPFASIGRIYDAGYHIQAAHYVGGLDALDSANAGRRRAAVIFGETEAPNAISPPLEISEGGLTLGRQQVEIASALWDSCLRADCWPGYESEPVIAEPPTYVMAKWEQRMQTDHTLNPLPAPETQ